MKKIIFGLLSIGILCSTSCTKKVDLVKEQEAIKAVFEADKDAYLKQDFLIMGDYWAKEPTSTKIWLSSGTENRIVGWDNINASQKKETEDSSWDRGKIQATFTDFQIDINGNSAAVYCRTIWNNFNSSQPAFLTQGRVVFMKKIAGKWKFSMIMIYTIDR